MVYVVHNAHKKSPKGYFSPVHDVSPAREFGEIVTLVGRQCKPFETDRVIEDMRKKLKNFCSDDYLVLIGSPVFIGLAFAIASQVSSPVNILHWNGKRREYQCISCDL